MARLCVVVVALVVARACVVVARSLARVAVCRARLSAFSKTPRYENPY